MGDPVASFASTASADKLELSSPDFVAAAMARARTFTEHVTRAVENGIREQTVTTEPVFDRLEENYLSPEPLTEWGAVDCEGEREHVVDFRDGDEFLDLEPSPALFADQKSTRPGDVCSGWRVRVWELSEGVDPNTELDKLVDELCTEKARVERIMHFALHETEEASGWRIYAAEKREEDWLWTADAARFKRDGWDGESLTLCSYREIGKWLTNKIKIRKVALKAELCWVECM